MSVMRSAMEGQAHSMTEEEAIRSLLKAETGAFLRRDFKALRRCWIDAPQSRFLINWPGVGAKVYCGIDEIVAMLSASVAEFPPVEDVDASIARLALNLVIGGDMAWASYDQVSLRNDPDFPLNGIQHEVKVFHRVQGEWKIACIVVIARTVEHLPDPMIEVGSDMTVLWANGPGHDSLSGHPGLMIGGNRLRARNRSFDADLREAVAWAHSKLVANSNKQRAGIDRIRAVSLGEDDEGGPLFCWVFIADGKVLLAFDEQGAEAAWPERAREVFRLSPAQLRLARLIVTGCDLTEAAGMLGVSVNTARTQLNRMFEKTGVHSQAALVRRLTGLRIPTKG